MEDGEKHNKPEKRKYVEDESSDYQELSRPRFGELQLPEWNAPLLSPVVGDSFGDSSFLESIQTVPSGISSGIHERIQGPSQPVSTTTAPVRSEPSLSELSLSTPVYSYASSTSSTTIPSLPISTARSLSQQPVVDESFINSFIDAFFTQETVPTVPSVTPSGIQECIQVPSQVASTTTAPLQVVPSGNKELPAWPVLPKRSTDDESTDNSPFSKVVIQEGERSEPEHIIQAPLQTVSKTTVPVRSESPFPVLSLSTPVYSQTSSSSSTTTLSSPVVPSALSALLAQSDSNDNSLRIVRLCQESLARLPDPVPNSLPLLAQGLSLDFSDSELLRQSILNLLNSCLTERQEDIDQSFVREMESAMKIELQKRERMFNVYSLDFKRELHVGCILERLFRLQTPYELLALQAIKQGTAGISGLLTQSCNSNLIRFILKDVIREYFTQHPEALCAVVRAGSLALLDFVLELFPSPEERLKLLCAENSRALYCAIFKNDTQSAEMLAAVFSDADSFEEAFEKSGDLYSAALFNADVLRVYMNKYATHERLYYALAKHFDIDEKNVIQGALDKYNYAAVKLIIETFSGSLQDRGLLYNMLLDRDRDGFNALYYAAVAGPAFFKLVTAAYPGPVALNDDINIRASDERSVLHYYLDAADNPSLEGLRLIFAAYRINGLQEALSAQDSDGDTVLHSAARRCAPEILDELLRRFENAQTREQVLALENGEGQTVNDILKERYTESRAASIVEESIQQAGAELIRERAREQERIEPEAQSRNIGMTAGMMLFLLTLLRNQGGISGTK